MQRTRRGKLIVIAALTLLSVGALSACGTGPPADETPAPTRFVATRPPGSPAAPIDIPANVGKDDHAQLTGAGSTFAAPLYTRWASDYKSNIASGVEVNYQSVGSGAGVQQITSQTVDFGASDAPMTDAELAKAPGDIQHIPTALGAVVVTYNLEGLSAPLKLDGDTIARIYLGDITKWDDEAIASQNNGADLPDKDIVVVHRADGSGTSFIFTDYLSNVSPDWADGPGTSKNPQWPEGLGGQGNEGVTQQVKQNKNSIGYVELGYAQANNLPIAQLKNKSGAYITPNAASTSAAASGIVIPDDYRVSIVDSPNDAAYPISGLTWVLLYKNQPDFEKGKALVDFLWWGIHDGQVVEEPLGYAPLPADLRTSVEHTLTTAITSGGEPVLRAP